MHPPKDKLAGTQPSLGMGTEGAPRLPGEASVWMGGMLLLLSPLSHLLLFTLKMDFLFLLFKMTLSFAFPLQATASQAFCCHGQNWAPLWC